MKEKDVMSILNELELGEINSTEAYAKLGKERNKAELFYRHFDLKATVQGKPYEVHCYEKISTGFIEWKILDYLKKPLDKAQNEELWEEIIEECEAAIIDMTQAEVESGLNHEQEPMSTVAPKDCHKCMDFSFYSDNNAVCVECKRDWEKEMGRDQESGLQGRNE